MAEEDEQTKTFKPDSAAAGAALHDPTNPDARDYLRAQTRLADLQSEDIVREDAVRHWSLRVRHISDVLKLGFDLAIAFIVVAIAVGLGLVIWQAAHADGLVIQAFNVPASSADKGLTGPVIASKLLDRLTVMQNETDSTRAPSSFANDWTNDIKVEIPDTGVSLGQVVRFLDSWLGHQMHLSGELYQTEDGIALTVRMDNDPGQTFQGKTRDLNGVIARAAEAVYSRAQPYRYSVYLFDKERFADALTAGRALAAAGPPSETAWADVGIALLMATRDDAAQARAALADGTKANPILPNLPFVLAGVEYRADHEQAALDADREGDRLLKGAGAAEWDQVAAAPALKSNIAAEAQTQGDFVLALADNVYSPGSGGSENTLSNRALFAVALHDSALATQALVGLDALRDDPAAAADAASTRALLALEKRDWRGAIALLDSTAAMKHKVEADSKGWVAAAPYLRLNVLPYEAYAYARLGDFGHADAILKALPADCDICARMYAKVDAARGDAAGAVRRLARVSARSPEIPFADTDWGEMLLRRGDLDGAIVALARAHKKGPHFADPLEMWGEALIAKNRSDLALAKFAEASKYAPHWGRLRLKWGEALYYAGQRDEARKQFAVAASLDLSPSEKTALARMNAP